MIADGVAYACSEGNQLNALDADTGKRHWTFTAEDNLRADPTVSGGVVYAADHSGTLSALDTATGAKLWSFPTGATVEYAPIVANGTLYLASGPDLHALAL